MARRKGPRPGNPYYLKNAVNTNAIDLDDALEARAVLLGFDLKDKTLVRSVRYLTFTEKLGSTEPIYVRPFRDVLCFPSRQTEKDVLMAAAKMMKDARTFRTPVGEDVEKVKKAYEKWQKTLAANKANNTDACRPLISAGIKVEEVFRDGQVAPDSSHSAFGTVIDKCVRSVISIALQKKPGPVSSVLAHRLRHLASWQELVEFPNSTAWADAAGRTGNSFGNVTTALEGAETYWGKRLKVWAQAFIEAQPKGFDPNSLYTALASESVNDPQEIRKLRDTVFLFFRKQACDEKYPSIPHLFRNIRRAYDPFLGQGYRKVLTEEDREMLLRCLKEEGFGLLGFTAASAKTGLATQKLYEWSCDYGLKKLQAEAKAYDLSLPEPVINRLA